MTYFGMEVNFKLHLKHWYWYSAGIEIVADSTV